MKTSSQKPAAIVSVQFDDSISLPPLTTRADSVESNVNLYLRRVFGPEIELTVSAGKVGRVSSGTQLLATFKVSPLASGRSAVKALAVAA
ncbi:hypothetical protein ACFVFF_23015 [Streptomyces sp. NPDC057680]|uniref:hypothetical protein n=1 Tax=Streptomyces sp. NPDC057680 TaxID=3346208 RepID=UPI0036CC19CA